MPRHISQPQARSRPPQELVQQLADELRKSKDRGQPVVVEDRLLTGLVQVQVIWDEFQSMPEENRIELILSAYEAAEGKEFRDKIVSAIGYTVPEADDFGLLPYKLVPSESRDFQNRHGEYWQAMKDEGAYENDEDQLELCFRTLAETTDAKDRLEKRLPGSKWSILKEVGQ